MNRSKRSGGFQPHCAKDESAKVDESAKKADVLPHVQVGSVYVSPVDPTIASVARAGALSVMDVVVSPCGGGAIAKRGGGVSVGIAAALSFCAASPVLSACRLHILGPAQRAARARCHVRAARAQEAAASSPAAAVSAPAASASACRGRAARERSVYAQRAHDGCERCSRWGWGERGGGWCWI